MARTPLFDLLRRAARISLSARLRGQPAREHFESTRDRYLSRSDGARFGRRDFHRASMSAAVLATFPAIGAAGCGTDSPSGPRVGIVGAGLAGLHAGYRLQQAGVRVDLFEAWNRTGGRTFTARGMLEGDQIVELGGELIDSNHATMMALADEFDLTLDDLVEPSSIRNETFFFDGYVIPEADLIAGFETVAPTLAMALMAADSDEAEYARLDALSIRELLASIPEASPLIRHVLEVAYTGEYGLEPDQQSCLNLVYLIDAETTEPFRIFGDSDERYHLHEGSQSIAEALTSRLDQRIHLDHKLVAVRSEGTRIKLVFESGAATIEEIFDSVVLTLPFTTLRDVEIEAGLLANDKQEIIDMLGYGQNSKLMMQFNGKPWRDTNMASGSAFADNGAQTLWETSRGQSGSQGILTYFAGGNEATLLASGSPEDQARRVLPFISEVFPATTADTWNMRALRMHWPDAPFHRGSYACYLPGQWAYFGVEKRAEGAIHFAGEHTSEDFQGYMEGAAESGARAAMEVLVELGLAPAESPLLRSGRRARARAFAAALRRAG